MPLQNATTFPLTIAKQGRALPSKGEVSVHVADITRDIVAGKIRLVDVTDMDDDDFMALIHSRT